MSGLDPARVYRTMDATECVWEFSYIEQQGVRAWWGSRRRPGETKGIAIGTFAEREILDRLHQNGWRLTFDDRIDLGAWLQSGGLERMLDELKESEPHAENG